MMLGYFLQRLSEMLVGAAGAAGAAGGAPDPDAQPQQGSYEMMRSLWDVEDPDLAVDSDVDEAGLLTPGTPGKHTQASDGRSGALCGLPRAARLWAAPGFLGVHPHQHQIQAARVGDNDADLDVENHSVDHSVDHRPASASGVRRHPGRYGGMCVTPEAVPSPAALEV